MSHECLKGKGFVAKFTGDFVGEKGISCPLPWFLHFHHPYRCQLSTCHLFSYLMSHECLKGTGFVAKFTGDFGFASAILSLISCNHVHQDGLLYCNLSCATSWIGASALVRCRCTYLSPAKKFVKL